MGVNVTKLLWRLKCDFRLLLTDSNVTILVIGGGGGEGINLMIFRHRVARGSPIKAALAPESKQHSRLSSQLVLKT